MKTLFKRVTHSSSEFATIILLGCWFVIALGIYKLLNILLA